MIPWDIELAKKHAEVDEIIDFSNFQYNSYLAIEDLIKNRWKKQSIVFGVHELIPYGYIIKLKQIISNIKVYKNPIEISKILRELRATKSDYEIQQLIRAAQIASEVIME